MEELKFLRELKSVTFATAQDDVPFVRIADVMLIEDDKIYFLTARGKAFYNQLVNNKNIALIGMDNDYKTVRISGNADIADCTYVDKIFEANPMMNDLYPVNTRDILEAFCISKGIGEIFDLSTKHPKRYRFAFGGASVIEPGYKINNDLCIKCKLCEVSCPVKAVNWQDDVLKINTLICLECGRCFEFCPVEAIEQPKKFILEES